MGHWKLNFWSFNSGALSRYGPKWHIIWSSVNENTMSYKSVSHAVTNGCIYFKFHWNVAYTCLQLSMHKYFEFHCFINNFFATTMQTRQKLHCFLQHISTFKCTKQAWSGAVCIYAYVKKLPKWITFKMRDQSFYYAK